MAHSVTITAVSNLAGVLTISGTVDGQPASAVLRLIDVAQFPTVLDAQQYIAAALVASLQPPPIPVTLTTWNGTVTSP